MEQAFQLEEISGPLAVVTFDVPGKKVNMLSQSVRADLSRLLDELERRPDFLGLLFRSGKSGQFVAGADLKELAALAQQPPEQSRHLIEQGHQLLSRLGGLAFPTVALVDGVALGGGTELLLACDYRLATTSARFGLPETKLGMIPAWGGTQRLPRVVAVPESLEMICGGEPVSADRAKSLGLADEIVESESLIDSAIRLIEMVRQGGTWQTRRNSRREPVGMTSEALDEAAAPYQRDVEGKSDPRSLAKLAALESMRKGLLLPLPEGLLVEQQVATKVIGSSGAADMIGEFFRNKATPA